VNSPAPNLSAGETPSNALAKLREFLRVKDADTLARLQPDSHAIAHSSGSWSNTVSLTWGDLREIERELHALQSAPVGEAAKAAAGLATQDVARALFGAVWNTHPLPGDLDRIREAVTPVFTRHFQQVVAENETLNRENAIARAERQAALLSEKDLKQTLCELDAQLATLNKELEGAKAFADEEEKRCAAFQATDAQLRTDLAQSQRERDGYWLKMCDTAEAMGKVVPEAAPHIVGWAKELIAARDALKARVGELEKLNVASYEQFPVRMTREAYLQDANTRDGLRTSLQSANATITALREAGGGLARAFEDTCNMLIDAELALARYGAHDEAEQLLKRRRAIPDVSTRWSTFAPAADGKTGGEKV